MTVEFRRTPDGLRVHDLVERVWVDVATDHPVDPAPAAAEGFGVPVDDAVTVDARELRFPVPFLTRVYDGDAVRGVYGQDTRIERAPVHVVDCTPNGMKLYVRVADTGLTIEHGQSTTIRFDDRTTVRLGARSSHERPAATVTTTEDPHDLMRAVSTFGSAMKTFSPERSYPTLRGHPPELALKSTLRIPDAVAVPDTGVAIEVPPTLDAVFTVTPLAYYLGATVRPGPTPALVAAGERLPLADPSLPAATARTLHQCFVLDCLVRTVGYYPVDLDELARFRARADIDVHDLYDQPLAERTVAYLDYPYDAVRDLLPWSTTTDVEPSARNAELLPYLAYRLSTIRSPPAAAAESTIPHDDPAPRERGPPRSSAPPRELPTVTLDRGDAHHAGWVGGAAPRAGTYPLLESYLAALDETPAEDAIDVHVVCTDDGMHDEVTSLYAGRADQPLDVHVTTGATVDELTEVLRSDADFFHFVGHATPTGLQCTDGVLDVATLEPGTYPAFFLNSCQSYYQGYELARKGSVGGIVSLDALDNERATQAGRLIADLVAFGCTFSQVLRGLERWSDLEYSVIGDGDFQLVASEDYTPPISTFYPGQSRDGEMPLRVEPFGEVGTELGVLSNPIVEDDDTYRLRAHYESTIDHDDVLAFLDGHVPFVVDDTLYWSSALSDTELRDLLELEAA